MEALKQTVRPKHQVLILKCYPRLPKNSSAAEIKPNGSELSYLLYYASSRRSKLSKVGTFLEKKTIHDLWKNRTASVQITLQILTAFLNDPAIGGAGPTGFGLFAPYILRILREVLKDANEAILVESGVPTWDSFCRHQDHVALNADADYRALFAEVVTLWAGYATKEQVQHKTIQRRGKMRVGVTDNVKLRMAGLQALKSTADSETLGTEAGRQLSTVMPVILQNLYDGDGDLDQIMELNAELETQEKDKNVKPRPSMMTMRDALDTNEDGDAKAAGFTVDEADRLADQEASLLALRCLKSVFTFENRQQIRTATNCVLRFIVAHRPNPIKFEKTQTTEDGEDQWAVQLFKAICVWTPVQDRFVAIFTAVEMLISSNVVEGDLYRQLLLTRIISKLLASDINLIGLSVMDVLLGLLQHILKILHVAAAQPASNGSPDNASASDSHHPSDASSKATPTSAAPVIDTETRKTPLRVRLLFQLQQCVSNLAVHVYYTDQISDMITAILLRLKPSMNPTPASLQVPHSASITSAGMLSANGEDNSSPAHSEAGITSNSSPRGTSTRLLAAGFFFATPTARETALLAIARILVTANRASGPEKNYVSTHRNPVPLNVWEGTTWLLRDTDVTVRSAFVKAFRTWLRFEMPKLGMEKSLEEEKKLDKERKRKSLNTDLARRAASTASAKKAASKRNQTAVLQSIHVAVVDALKEETPPPSVQPEMPQIFDLNTALSTLTPSSAEFPASAKEDLPPSPASTIHLELNALNAELDATSAKLSLLPVDDFRALQVPSVPAHPPSPKNGTGLIPALPGSSNGNSSSRIAEEEEDSPARQGSRAGSMRQGSVGASLNGNGNRRGGNRSPAPGQVGCAQAGRFDRHDFANGSAEGVRVEELKRILDGEGGRSVSLSRSRGGSGGGENGSMKNGIGSLGVGKTREAKRSTSLGAGGTGGRKGSGLGKDSGATSGVDDGESDSLVEFEGSWGTSFASHAKERQREKRDLSQLLEGIRVDVREGGGGLGRAPT